MCFSEHIFKELLVTVFLYQNRVCNVLQLLLHLLLELVEDYEKLHNKHQNAQLI